MTETTKTPRQLKTARQRAQEALDFEQARVLRLDDKQAALAERIDRDIKARNDILEELAAAQATRDFLARHPALSGQEEIAEPEVDPAQMALDDEGESDES